MKRYHYFLTCKCELKDNFSERNQEVIFNCELRTNNIIDNIDRWGNYLRKVFEDISKGNRNAVVKNGVLLFYNLMKTIEVSEELPTEVIFLK